nr:MAG TPA: hypothetical protein [Caudoviricetes sp.]
MVTTRQIIEQLQTYEKEHGVHEVKRIGVMQGDKERTELILNMSAEDDGSKFLIIYGSEPDQAATGSGGAMGNGQLTLRCKGIRELCIANHWYTRGNIQEYGKMLEIEEKENVTLADATRAARDIFEHSDRGTLNEITCAVVGQMRPYYVGIDEEE